MIQPDTHVDPFADSEGRPAVSFKDQPIGTSYTMQVEGPPSLVQSIDYETRERATWPDGNPKMSAVIEVVLDGEARSLWASKPSSMYAALRDAQHASGAKIAAGGTLTVTFVGEKPNSKNPRLNPAKQYTAVYTPGAPPALDEL